MSETRKIFVLDTSVVIHDPQCIQTFGDNDVVVPLALISEIDGFKTGEDQKGFNAREFSRMLDHLKEEHETLLQFVPLPPPATGGICISGAGEYVHKVPKEFDQARKDREIIATALRWATEKTDRAVVLVSKDTNVRLMGHACGLVTEDYKRGKIKNVDQLSHSTTVATVDDGVVDRLMRDGVLPLQELGPAAEGIRENQCLTLLGGEGHGKSALATVERTSEGIVLRRLLKDECRMWTLMPRNREQIFASALLKNPATRLVTLVGKAGTGKTLLAMAAGLDQVLDPKRRLYRKIVVMRPLISVGKEMGWLPGDVNEKIHPWMKPIFDNVQFLLGDDRAEKKDKVDHGQHQYKLQQLLEQGVIELEALSFVRGRSINDAFIVIDEAQNLTPHEIKTLMTRAAGKSKVVLTGDLQQIDTPYLDAHSSGLTHVVKKFGEHPIAGHVTLVKGERSELAELAADLL